jgi:hypothetical protein
MSAPDFVAASSSASQIVLIWSAPTGSAAGGQSVSISDYVLSWDGGSGSWATLPTPTGTTATVTGLVGGTTYQYRIAAQNKHGTGAVSTVVTALAAQAPGTPAAPTAALQGIYVKVAWVAPSSGFAIIDQYQVLIADGSGNFAEHTSLCDGSSSSVISNLYCLILMTSLWGSPLSLPQAAAVQAQVLAHNERGWSGTSAANSDGVLVETVPHTMAAPTRGAGTSDTLVQINWLATAAPDDGGSPVLGYALYTDNGVGGGASVELAGYSALYTATTFTISDSVVAAATYRFQVMAKNRWGWGSLSPAGPILAATTPPQMGSPSTSIDSSTGGVSVTWNALAQTGGLAITAYLIEIQASSGAWNSDAACDGSSATTRDGRSCVIPMSRLAGAPNSLSLAALV